MRSPFICSFTWSNFRIRSSKLWMLTEFARLISLVFLTEMNLICVFFQNICTCQSNSLHNSCLLSTKKKNNWGCYLLHHIQFPLAANWPDVPDSPPLWTGPVVWWWIAEDTAYPRAPAPSRAVWSTRSGRSASAAPPPQTRPPPWTRPLRCCPRPCGGAAETLWGKPPRSEQGQFVHLSVLIETRRYLMKLVKRNVVLRMMRAARDSSCWQRCRMSPSSMWPSEWRQAWFGNDTTYHCRTSGIFQVNFGKCKMHVFFVLSFPSPSINWMSRLLLLTISGSCTPPRVV